MADRAILTLELRVDASLPEAVDVLAALSLVVTVASRGRGCSAGLGAFLGADTVNLDDFKGSDLGTAYPHAVTSGFSELPMLVEAVHLLEVELVVVRVPSGEAISAEPAADKRPVRQEYAYERFL